MNKDTLNVEILLNEVFKLLGIQPMMNLKEGQNLDLTNSSEDTIKSSFKVYYILSSQYFMMKDYKSCLPNISQALIY